MTNEQADRVINPPVFMSDDLVILDTPISSVSDYMKWIHDNKEDLRKFFGLDDD